MLRKQLKKVIQKPEEEWIVVENNHEPIIGKREYDLVHKVMGYDTRTAPDAGAVYPLCGIMVCADCGAGMVKKVIPAGGKKYEYYVCNKNKNRSI